LRFIKKLLIIIAMVVIAVNTKEFDNLKNNYVPNATTTMNLLLRRTACAFGDSIQHFSTVSTAINHLVS